MKQSHKLKLNNRLIMKKKKHASMSISLVWQKLNPVFLAYSYVAQVKIVDDFRIQSFYSMADMLFFFTHFHFT